jgi:hypothetical protein
MLLICSLYFFRVSPFGSLAIVLSVSPCLRGEIWFPIPRDDGDGGDDGDPLGNCFSSVFLRVLCG